MPRKKTIAFDFDGTLADSFGVFVHAIEYALGHKPFTPEEIEELRAHSMREVIKLLDIKKWQLPLLVAKGMREIDRHQNDITIFPSVTEMLQKLSTSGYKLFIVTSHSEKGVQAFLEQYNLRSYFEHIYAKVGLWGKPKALLKLQKQYGYQNDECLFVGDEVRDIEAAEKAGVACLAVTWGFNTAASLKAHNPEAVVDKPADIVRYIENEG